MTTPPTPALARAALIAIATVALAPASLAGPSDKYGGPGSAPATHSSSAGYRSAPGSVWLQVESHPDLATTLQRARVFSLTYEHTAAFETTTGWYAIVIGVAERDSADAILANLMAAAAIPYDSLLTTGGTYLARVWPPDAAAGAGDLDAAIARERSWSLETRKGVQNALIWTGDYNSVLDGEIGPRTREAIRSFQRTNGFAATGYLTPDQVALLEERRIAAVAAAGFEIVDDYETGIRIGLPQAMVRRAARDGIFVVYEPWPGQPSASLLLLSSQAGPGELRWFFDFLIDEYGFGPADYSVFNDDRFVISGSRDGLTTYVHVRAGYGAVKGFILIWPETEEAIYRPVSTAMFNSFEPIRGFVLDPADTSAPPDAATVRLAPKNKAGAGVRPEPAPPPRAEPIATGTGFVVDSAGLVLTNAHVIEGCPAVGIAEDIPASVIAADPDIDLALLRAEDGGWPVVARFAGRPARLNADVTVVGFPLHGLLGGLNVTRGAVSAAAGLGNDAARFQITAAVQPGNSGGPVLDASGAVVGVVQSKLDAIVVAEAIGDIPQNVNFAIRGAVAQVFLARHNVDFALAMPGEAIAPADLAEEAQGYTVLVRCLAR